MWIVFVIIGLPSIYTGISVWAKQGSNDLRYVPRSEMVQIEKRLTKAETIDENRTLDIAEIKKSQAETRKDIKEILKYLRD